MRSTKNRKIYEKVAINNNVSPQVVKDVYESMFRFIRERIVETDGLAEKSEEDFKKLRLSFNVPILGKFFITHQSIQRQKNQKKAKNEYIKNKENKTSIQ